MSEKYHFLPLNFSKNELPVFKEAKEGEIVMFGAQNDYPDYLVDLKNKSARHGAILSGKVRYIAGNGFKVDEFQRGVSQVAEIQRLTREINRDESLDELILKVCDDHETFGGFYLECVWDKAHKKIVEVYQLPFALMRLVNVGYEKVNGVETPVYKFCYLPNWKGIRKYDRAKEKDGFKEFNLLGTSNDASEVLYISDYRSAKSGESQVYPLPCYISAVPLIEADGEIANYRLNNVKNGFWASKIITFNNGVPTLEEQKQIKKGIIDQHTGSDNAGTFALMFSDGNNPPTVVDLTGGDLDKQFLDVDKAIQTTIGTAHQVVSMTLFGVATEGALGQRNEMLDAYQLFYSNYVLPRQKTLEDAFNYVFSFNGIQAGLKLNAVKPLNIQFSEAVITQYLTKDEIRSLIIKDLGLDMEELKHQKYAKEQDAVVEYFSKCGRETKEEDIICTFDVHGLPQPQTYKEAAFAKIFELDLEADDFGAKVLSILNDAPETMPEKIAQALDTDTARVEKKIAEFLADGVLIGDLGNLKISKGAQKALDELESNVLEIVVEYRYKGPVDSKNRDFCSNMMGLARSGRTYTQDEVENMPASPDALQEIGSVWDYRGGWWTRKGGGKTTPYCRHIWEAVVKRKQ